MNRNLAVVVLLLCALLVEAAPRPQTAVQAESSVIATPGEVNVALAGTTVLASLSTGQHVSALGCVVPETFNIPPEVESPVFPVVDLRFVGGTTKVVPLYAGSLVFGNQVQPFASGKGGSVVGDRFVLPLGFTLANDLVIEAQVVAPISGTGRLLCTVIGAD